MNDRKPMTKAEREDLVRLIKQREKVAKTSAEQRSAALLADFERNISAVHEFDKNEVWKAAVDAAITEAKKANVAIDTEAERLGIPKEFRPRLSWGWQRRGENEFKQRREELRRVAKAEIEALEKLARVQIETASVEAQTQVIATGLTSEAAIAFLEKLPPVDSMMPALSIETIQAKLAEKARNQLDYRGPHIVRDGGDDD